MSQDYPPTLPLPNQLELPLRLLHLDNLKSHLTRPFPDTTQKFQNVDLEVNVLIHEQLLVAHKN